jgi:2'-hydroxyisoflavone reductase
MAYADAYGALKRSAELAAEARLGEGALLLRVGLLVGAGDYMDRFPWWVRRIDEGGIVPVPEPRDRPVQVIDVRDVAAFAVSAAERGLSGPYTVTGRAVSMERLLGAVASVSGSGAAIAWRPEAAFEAAGVRPWTELPLWIPASVPEMAHMLDVDVSRAHAAGLETRPLEDTARQVLDWDRARRPGPMANGIDRETEAAILAG